MGSDWDQEKAIANLAKHGVSFEEADTVFDDRLATSIVDPDHSDVEDRWLTTGESNQGRLLVVWHTDSGGHANRIIGARRAAASERRTYESGE